jgi:hypothetical protein
MDTNTAAIMRLTTWPDSDSWGAACDFVYGKGSRTFLRSLSGYHYRKHRDKMRGSTNRFGVTIYKHVFYVSQEAQDVWRDPELRQQWLAYHRTTQRLLGNS